MRQAEARAGSAAADLRRVRSLYENDNAARTDLDAATAAADSAAAQVESAENRLGLARRQVEYTRLTAPVSGVIADVLAEVNENVSPGQPVVVLASGSAPEVGFAVPEVVIGEIREDMPVEVAFDAVPGARFEGAVTEVGVASTATGTTFPVTVRLGPDAAEIRSGWRPRWTWCSGPATRRTGSSCPRTRSARIATAGSCSSPSHPRTDWRWCGDAKWRSVPSRPGPRSA